MSKQNTSPNDNYNFESDLEAIENAMNSMMQGAFSMIFKELVNGNILEPVTSSSPDMTHGIAIDTDHNAPMGTTTTIFNGRNIFLPQTNEGTAVEEKDGYGGSDFKRLANKSKQKNRNLLAPIPTENEDPLTSSSKNTSTRSVFNLLFPPTSQVFNRDTDPLAPPPPLNSNRYSNDDNDNGVNWSYTSTSSRTVYHPDGSQEKITTRKSNGIIETVKQIRYPDGQTVETREQKQSLWNRLWG